MKFSCNHKIWLLFIFLAVILVYYPALSTYFSQDDFTHFTISKAGSIKDILKFFVPVSTGIFYRPLSVQLYTYISRSLFGLNPSGFHLTALGFHLGSVALVFLLLKQLTKNSVLGLLGALFYGVHPSHFMSLFWAAEFSMVLGPFFALAAVLAFLRERYYWFWGLMFLGLLSNELVAAVPLILAWRAIVYKRKIDLKWLVLPVLMVIGLFWLRFIYMPASLGSEYVLSFSPLNYLNNLRWHLVRALGYPEGFRAHMDMNAIKLAMGYLVIALLVVAIHGIRNRVVNKRLLILGLGWFLLSLLPVSFLARHQSPIYQIIGIPGIFLSLMAVIPKIGRLRLGILAIAGLFVIASFWAVRAQDKYHWVTKRARMARYHMEKLKKQAPGPNSTVVFLNTVPNSSTEVYFSLGAGNAVKVYFGDEVKAIFEDFTDSVSLKDQVYVLSSLL